jgi:acyl transferase domain-containing protein
VLELRNIVWLKPLVILEHKQVSIAVFALDDEQLGYEVYSLEDKQKIVHCQGIAVFGGQSRPTSVDIEQLKGQMEQGELEAATVYAMFAAMGLYYGPAHQGITSISLGEKQLLAQLRLPVGIEAGHDAYVLHPSLIDSALQASIGLIFDLNHIPSEPSVPFVLKSLRLISACTKQMAAWARYSKEHQASNNIVSLDIDLYDDHGNVCVQMHGFTLRGLSGFGQGEPKVVEGHSSFDSSFYEKLIAHVANDEVSVDEAAALG